ncbi:MAG: efflux RND transporter periplasmic adaptor subunit [Planctomycetia bacterium]|nr:efflux RND transporter periplasmic adaptor subunit [Planctomycetia bacterium]
MKRKWWVVGLAAVLVAGTGIGLGARGLGARGPEGPVGPDRTGICANGITEGGREELALRAEVSGTIRALHVRANQDVRRGDLRVELDNALQQAQVQRAEARARGCEADCDRARDLCDRARRSGSGTSVQELKIAEAVLLKTRADWDMALAELALARAEWAKTQLRAPWDGRVLRVYDEPGARVAATSARPILLLADVSKRRVRAFIEELSALRVREGQAVQVTLDGLPDQTFDGRVSSEILLRMDRDVPHADRPGEYHDIYHRPVLIDLIGGEQLPLNLRVRVRIEVR